MKRLLLWIPLLLLLAGCTAPAPSSNQEQTSLPSAPQQAEDTWGRTVSRHGQTWRCNTRLTTVLFMGVDTKASKEEQGYLGTGGRSDTMLLLVLNPDTRTTELISISRDTMAKVGIYNRDREKIADGFMQITMQYAFGDNPKRSCMLSKKAVSEMLLDLPIDFYCSMTLDGISAAVNRLGGLTVVLRDDWTDISPEYTAGAAVTMDAHMVERFLRYRDVEVSGSNTVRVERQSWFIRQMLETLLYSGKVSAEQLLSYVQPYLETDMTAETIRNLADYRLSDETRMIPGGVIEGKKHDEFYIDEEALKDLLLDVFYYRVSQ